MSKYVTADEYEKYNKFIKDEPCDDAVSREAVKELIKSGVSTDTYDDVEHVCKWIDALPPVTPSITRDIEKSNFSQEQYLLDTDSAYQIGYEQGHKDAEQKSGKWIEQEGWDGDVYYECSVCGESFCLIEGTPTDNMYNYCPNCGCRMVEPQESEDKE